MAGDATLIVTTRGGARPLGVRGEPLHDAAPQLRRVVRRRLGDAAADLLAEPQRHEDGAATDWYAGWPGDVRPLAALAPAERAALRRTIDESLAEIRRLGDSLAAAGPREAMGLVGLSLQLAARAPSDDFLYAVGGRPVIVCWGYEADAAGAPLPAVAARPPLARPERRPVLGPAAPDADHAAGRGLAVPPAAAGVPWLRAVLLALPLLAALLGAAWLLRTLLPAEPDWTLATREGPPPPPAPAPPADPLPALKASLSSEASRARVLQVELALAEAELKKRIADCKPVEPPRPPPQTALAPPPPAPAPSPAPAPARPAPPPAPPLAPNDNRLRLPSSPSNDYSFLAGCWRTDPFRHEVVQSQPGVSSYCFDSNGSGQLEWRRGRTACRTRAQARFEGTVLRLRDSDTTCNDGSRWYADQLVCHRGTGNVALCSGSSHGAYGPVSWTVNLHKLR